MFLVMKVFDVMIQKDLYCGILPSYLKAVFESFAHQIESNWINAGIHGGHVDANVVQYQQETTKQ